MKDTSPIDLIIIGSGIHGAILAYEAAKYGYHVSLLEKDDFGGSTSANSLKIVHGGIRYLQHLNLKRMRESIRSRRSMMQFAPHLVKPLPCLMPTYGHGLKGRETMRVAFGLYDLIAFDRNQGLPERSHLPPGGGLSLDQCYEHLPNISRDGLNGAALWYDAIALNTERLLQEYLNEAQRFGANLHNYSEVTAIIQENNRVTGVEVRDRKQGGSFTLASRMIINASGPWVDALTSAGSGLSPVSSGLWAKAINLVVKKKLFENYAVGLEGWSDYTDKDAIIKRGKRLFFFVPWRQEYTMIGTSYKPADQSQPHLVEKSEVTDMLDEINKIYPGAELTWEDVSFVHSGLLPRTPETNEKKGGDSVQLAKATRIIDHLKEDSVDNIISISGVKYTTAPDIAWKTLKLVSKRLGPPPTPGCYRLSPRKTVAADHTPVIKTLGQTYYDIVNHLKTQYGGQWRAVFNYLKKDENGLVEEPLWLSKTPPLLEAEVHYFIACEQAVKLSDVILRRSDLGSAECPAKPVLEAVAAVMAERLDWDQERCESEIEQVHGAYYPLTPFDGS